MIRLKIAELLTSRGIHHPKAQQAHLSYHARISQYQAERLLAGAQCHLDTLDKVCAAYQVTPFDLIEFAPSPYKERPKGQYKIRGRKPKYTKYTDTSW